MLIEFFGLPGAGKTTMSRRVADLLLERQLIVDETTHDLGRKYRRLPGRLVKFAEISRYAVAHTGRALSDALKIAGTRQATPLDLSKSIFNWLFISSIASRKRSPVRITILDQGVAQAISSIGFAAQRESWLDEIFDEVWTTVLKPDLIIHMRADFQMIGDRLETRAQHLSRMDALGRDHDVLQREEAHGDGIIGRLKSCGVPVIDIQNDTPNHLTSGARCIADAIVTMLSEQRLAPPTGFDTVRGSRRTSQQGAIIP